MAGGRNRPSLSQLGFMVTEGKWLPKGTPGTVVGVARVAPSREAPRSATGGGMAARGSSLVEAVLACSGRLEKEGLAVRLARLSRRAEELKVRGLEGGGVGLPGPRPRECPRPLRPLGACRGRGGSAGPLSVCGGGAGGSPARRRVVCMR